MTSNGIMAVTAVILDQPNSALGSFDGQLRTRNSSGDEIANVNFLYDNIVHALKIQ